MNTLIKSTVIALALVAGLASAQAGTAGERASCEAHSFSTHGLWDCLPGK